MLATACALLVAAPTATLAQVEPTPVEDPAAVSVGALQQHIAVLYLEALGMDAERVARLESLFRMELSRLAGRHLPTRRDVEQVISRSRKLQRCAGEDACLAAIGAALGVEVVVTGNVAALGDSFIINIKAVDVKSGAQVRRVASDPLRGSPDELIESVRVAAYRLLAPEQLLGSVTVLTDMVGARVFVDGQQVGTTPLTRPIGRLPLGKHTLRVEADGYVPFEDEVEVRFQKSTRVVVRLAIEATPTGVTPVGAGPRVIRQDAPHAWYSSPWVYVGAGILAGVVGGVVGYQLGKDPVIDCSQEPAQCR